MATGGPLPAAPPPQRPLRAKGSRARCRGNRHPLIRHPPVTAATGDPLSVDGDAAPPPPRGGPLGPARTPGFSPCWGGGGRLGPLPILRRAGGGRAGSGTPGLSLLAGGGAGRCTCSGGWGGLAGPGAFPAIEAVSCPRPAASCRLPGPAPARTCPPTVHPREPRQP